MASQYPFFSLHSTTPSSTTTTTTRRRNKSLLIKALKDSSSSSSSTSSESDPVKLALARAKAYKKSIQSNPPPPSKIAQNQDTGGSEISEFGGNKDDSGPLSSRAAMEGAREYSERNRAVEERNDKKEEPRVSAIDFVGLGFADKKEGRGLPAGLIPISDPFPAGDMPDVEFIAGDTSKFGNEQSDTAVEEDSELYKPKVSTWGVFPRPNNISKTYGGGKTIRPGDVLETAESKAAKEAQTRQLIAAYKRKIGLNIDPKLKSECEKDLKDGDSLMDCGKLKDAIPFYERVMDKLVYQSELHGVAALQWSICKDSLNRSDEARVMYEKLQSHPNVRVSKKARQFVFSFQAMEMMKVTNSSNSQLKTGYQNFFDAFIENKNNPSSDETEMEEDASLQALPYVIFLVSPILMVLVIAVQKRLV